VTSGKGQPSTTATDKSHCLTRMLILWI